MVNSHCCKKLPTFDILNSNMTPRRKGQNCKYFKTPLSRNSQKRSEHKENQTKYRKMTWKPRSHVRILIYQTWAFLRASVPMCARTLFGIFLCETWSEVIKSHYTYFLLSPAYAHDFVLVSGHCVQRSIQPNKKRWALSF